MSATIDELASLYARHRKDLSERERSLVLSAYKDAYGDALRWARAMWIACDQDYELLTEIEKKLWEQGDRLGRASQKGRC